MTISNSTISFSSRPVLISDRLEGCVCGCLSPASTVTIIGLDHSFDADFAQDLGSSMGKTITLLSSSFHY